MSKPLSEQEIELKLQDMEETLTLILQALKRDPVSNAAIERLQTQINATIQRSRRIGTKQLQYVNWCIGIQEAENVLNVLIAHRQLLRGDDGVLQ